MTKQVKNSQEQWSFTSWKDLDRLLVLWGNFKRLKKEEKYYKNKFASDAQSVLDKSK